MPLILAFILFLASNSAYPADGRDVLSDENILGLIKDAPTQADLPNMSAVYLLMEENDTVNEDGTATYMIHVIWKILDKQAIPSGEVSIPFNSNEATLNIDLARTITPDNTVVNVANESIREITPYSGFPMYTDLKVKQFSMPAMEIGSVAEYKATLKLFKPVMPGYFYSYWSFPAGRTVKQSTFEVTIPSSMEGRYLARNTDIVPETSNIDGKKRYRWVANDIFIGDIFEPYLPPYDMTCPNVIFVAKKTWLEIAKWFYSMAETQLEPTAEMKSFVDGIVKKDSGDREKIARDLYNFVSQNIRYVAMPLKSSDYQPHKVADIYKNKYGDCKDKSALLISLYRLAGMEAYFALLRTRPDGSVNAEFPAIDFTHCVVAVPKAEGAYILLDPTLELNRFGYVPANLQDVAVFIVKKDGYEFVKVPLEYDRISGVDLSMDMRIKDDYAIEINEKDEFSGDAEVLARLNAKYTTPDAMKAHIEETLQSIYTKPKLITFSTSNPDDLDESFWMRSKYEVRDHIKEAGDLLILDLPNPLAMNLNSAVSTDRRTYPLWFPAMHEDSTVINILIPLNCKVNYIPASIEKDSPFGYYSREVSSNVDKITIRYYYKAKMIEIPEDRYEEFKSFVNETIKSIKESIVLEKEKVKA